MEVLLVLVVIGGFFYFVAQANNEREQEERRIRYEQERRLQEKIANERKAKQRLLNDELIRLKQRFSSPQFATSISNSSLTNEAISLWQEEIRKAKQAEELAIKQAKERKEKLATYNTSSINGFNYVYLSEYYPKNRYEDNMLNYSQISDRHRVWNFKDGRTTIASQMVAEYLKLKYSKEELSRLIFCVIPASTITKSNIRYNKFCQEVSNQTGMVNGYSFIQVLFDREDSRNKKSNDTIYNLSFDQSELRNKSIVLFDDVITRGTSFSQIASKLNSIGCKQVDGVFLAKTV